MEAVYSHSLLLSNCLLFILCCCCSANSSRNFSYVPSGETVNSDSSGSKEFFVNAIINVRLITNGPADDLGELRLQVVDDDPQILKINSINGSFYCEPNSIDCSTVSSSFALRGLYLGRAKLEAEIVLNGKKQYDLPPYEVSVIRAPFVVNTIFNIILPILVVINTITFACKLDLTIVRDLFRKSPWILLLGWAMQFILMPLLAFAITRILGLDPVLALGLFALGCSPGGGSSNVWTVLLDGDINLSLTMTFISNFACLVMMPAWLYSLGQLVVDQNKVVIPFANVAYSLAAIAGGCGMGLIIRRLKPALADWIATKLKIVALVFILVVIPMAIIGNLYIFVLLAKWKVLIGGMLLAWVGLVIATIIAKVLGLSWARVRTLAIETTIQNTGVPIILLRNSIGQPEADLGTVMPVSGAIFTPLPLAILLVIRIVYSRFFAPKAEPAEKADETEMKKKESDKQKATNQVATTGDQVVGHIN